MLLKIIRSNFGDVFEIDSDSQEVEVVDLSTNYS